MRQRILATIDSIPAGQVASYGQVAAQARLGGRARLVVRLLARLSSDSALPWHRVLAADGRVSLAGAAGREQRRRLRAEGVGFRASGRVDLALHAWRPE